MRLFVSLEVPPDLLELAMGLQKTIQHTHSFQGTFPLKNQLHITLSFLPLVKEQESAIIHDILGEIVQHYHPFHLAARELVILPHHHPRLVWLSLHEHNNIQSIENLATTLHQRLRAIGATQEHQYKPHITLARIKHLNDRDSLQHSCTSVTLPPTLFHLDTLCLKQSLLSSTGPQHITLATYRVKE